MTSYAGFQEGFALVNELAAEVASVMKLRGQLPDQHWARAAVRSVFALFEGFISRFKGRALEVEKFGGITFPPKLLRIIHEGEMAVNEDGFVAWEHIRPPTKENLKGALRAYSTALNTTTPLGGSVALPAGFATALALRNRITHPKVLTDLEVTSDEFQAVGEVLQWTMAIAQWSKDQEHKHIEDIRSKVAADFAEARAQLQRQRADSEGPDAKDFNTE